MIVIAQVASEASNIAQFVPILILTLIIGWCSNNIARTKGRNVGAWTFFGLLPIIGFYSLVLLVGAADLKTQNEIDELKKRLDRLESLD